MFPNTLQNANICSLILFLWSPYNRGSDINNITFTYANRDQIAGLGQYCLIFAKTITFLVKGTEILVFKSRL